jgi:hypothetical protein
MHNYNTKDFLEVVRNYKYIVSMENSEEDTYITEKIMHGLLAGCMPIYWGSPRVLDYFNERRIVLKDEVKSLSNEEWLNHVNEEPLTKFGKSLTVQEIARQVRNVINRKDYKYPEITEVYCICNKEYEEVRYSRMSKLLREFVNEDRIRIMGSTYKNTIDDTIYNKYVKKDLVLNMRPIPTRRSELSLTLNWLEVLEDIERRYKDGIFLILESDVEILELSESYSLEEYSFNRALKQLSRESGKWDCISFGYSKKDEMNISYNPYKTPYRDNIDTMEILNNSINDLNVPEDKIIFHRKFNPRCTDNLLFSYSGIQKLLNHMKRDENYGVPFDYYFMNFLESEMTFKFYWSNITYFNQLTNQGKESSTIQCDKN